jgi:hypothetical protein
MNKKAAALVMALIALGVAGFVIAVFMIPPNGGAGEAGGGEKVKLGARSSQTPKNWVKEEPSNKLRLGQFRVPKAKGDDKDAEVALFHFPGGGSVKENLERWKAKFKAPKGKKLDDISKVDTFKVNGVDVTYLDISGDYVFQVKTPMPDHRMIAIYFDSDDGPFFITLIGPENTVAAAKKGFDSWLKGFK